MEFRKVARHGSRLIMEKEYKMIKMIAELDRIESLAIVHNTNTS